MRLGVERTEGVVTPSKCHAGGATPRRADCVVGSFRQGQRRGVEQHLARAVRWLDQLQATLALRPSYHWTDQQLYVHAWLCVVAYLPATRNTRARPDGSRRGYSPYISVISRRTAVASDSVSAPSLRPSRRLLIARIWSTATSAGC